MGPLGCQLTLYYCYEEETIVSESFPFFTSFRNNENVFAAAHRLSVMGFSLMTQQENGWWKGQWIGTDA